LVASLLELFMVTRGAWATLSKQQTMDACFHNLSTSPSFFDPSTDFKQTHFHYSHLSH